MHADPGGGYVMKLKLMLHRQPQGRKLNNCMYM
jgi:hypothetical protein